MKLIFAKRYNPAYDYFLTKYFQDHGIPYGEESTFEEVKRLVLVFQEKAGMNPRWKDIFNPSAHKLKIPESETLFCLYAWYWALGPGPRPAFQELFAKSLGITRYPDAGLYRELERSLPAGRGKLLFSEEEASKDIAKFYKRYISDPLRQDLKRGGTDRRITKYFTSDELDRILREGRLASEARERVVKEIVSDLVEWLDGITPAKVLGDIERIVAEHDGPSQHMKKPEELKGGRLDLCRHESEYVEFSVYWSPEGQDLSYFLKPVRGYGLVEEVVGKGWQDVIFPWFYGMKS